MNETDGKLEWKNDFERKTNAEWKLDTKKWILKKKKAERKLD